MNFAEEVRGACLDVLSCGLLRIRHARDLESAQREGYHLHNLPQLVRTPVRPLLDYYLDIERPDFLRGKPDYPEMFEEAWQRLERARRSAPE